MISALVAWLLHAALIHSIMWPVGDERHAKTFPIEFNAKFIAEFSPISVARENVLILNPSPNKGLMGSSLDFRHIPSAQERRAAVQNLVRPDRQRRMLRRRWIVNFSRLRRAEIGTHHHIAGPYLHQYAGEMSWREDNRRVPNGTQAAMVAAAVMGSNVSRAWKGYWQRGN